MEIIALRINEHQKKDGVQEYSLQVALPGRYQTTFTGASQQELGAKFFDAMGIVFNILGIPGQVERIVEQPTKESVPVFMDSNGDQVPVSRFAATAKAKFTAQVTRNGKVVED